MLNGLCRRFIARGHEYSYHAEHNPFKVVYPFVGYVAQSVPMQECLPPHENEAIASWHEVSTIRRMIDHSGRLSTLGP